ncbi:hypothetical protein N0V90_002594 [Kalmusia sp. IMI 367209]|nr:hypothetical protein N0V90_002594 [Kalmusia sp. IMI 367209]
MPTFEEYRNAGFPFKWLDEKEIASQSTLPKRLDDPAPVLALQATFISGGLLLTFSAQHNCMDMTGQSQVIRLFAKACHEPSSFTTEELRIGTLTRKGIIPLSGEIPGVEETSMAKAPEIPSLQTQEPEPRSKAIWSYFIFSATALSAIKSLAMKEIHTNFISTDDAICAFIWKHLTKSRLSRLRSASTKSTFERQVDVRKHLGIPPTYTGNVVYKTSTSLLLEDVISKPLGYLASQLRTSLSPTPDLGNNARKAATFLDHKLKSGQMNYNSVERGTIPPMDIKMSSWAKETCYEFDFSDLLGKPEAVRRPNFEGWEGLAYLMPKGRDGQIAVALCLREEDLMALNNDKEFTAFGRYVG